MATIIVKLSDAAKAIAERHAIELGYDGAADWAFELLRNYAATREDAMYTRMHTGEHNTIFGRSKREQNDLAARAAAEAAENEKRAKEKAERKE